MFVRSFDSDDMGGKKMILAQVIKNHIYIDREGDTESTEVWDVITIVYKEEKDLLKSWDMRATFYNEDDAISYVDIMGWEL